jgi:hypothetical protein
MDAPGEPQAGGTFAAARTQRLRAPVLWGVVFGGIQAASPLGFWWLDPATVYPLSLTLIAAVYISFAVADGRPVSNRMRDVRLAGYATTSEAARSSASRLALAARVARTTPLSRGGRPR